MAIPVPAPAPAPVPVPAPAPSPGRATAAGPFSPPISIVPGTPVPARAITRLILDLVTPAEVLVRIPIAVGLVVLVLALISWWEGAVSLTSTLLVSLACGAGISIGTKMTSATSCYYIVDVQLQQVLYHQKILGHLRLIPWVAFEDVERLELVTQRAWRMANEERGPGHWYRTYELFLVDRRGGRTRIADTADSDEQGTGLLLGTLESRGWQAAALIDCPFVLREPRRWGLLVVAFALAGLTLGVVSIGLGLPLHTVAIVTLVTLAAFGLMGLIVVALEHLATRGQEPPKQCAPTERLRLASTERTRQTSCR